MSISDPKYKSSDQISDFFARIFGMTRKKFEALSNLPEIPPKITAHEVLRIPGVMAPNNQPEFWADAPWRLEPDQTEIPITIYMCDANVDSPGYCGGPSFWGPLQTVELDGVLGYCRLQAQTVGMDGERFCCFTNPIWIRISDGQRKILRISFTSRMV